jgi:glyoxylase-like metal-dependent hydrolase (beta-lactamase superfamily II)
MKKAIPACLATAVLSLALCPDGRPEPAGFQKVSPHFFYMQSTSGGANTGAVITTEGVLLIDPPPEAGVPAMLNALKALTSRPVLWIVATDYRQAYSGGLGVFLKQGATVIGSKELDRLAGAAPVPSPDQPEAPAPARPNPRFLFGQQLHLWPANIEIRILAVRSKARTAGDVVVFLPSEKVLATGDFFSPSAFPIIDTDAGEGSARGWIEGLKQVVEAVPLLKSAMPQPKTETPVPPEPEKTLEEQVSVIPGHGDPANLQQMKELLAAAQKLRTEAYRAVTAGRTRDYFIKSLSADVFGGYGNLEAFASQLFDDLSRK